MNHYRLLVTILLGLTIASCIGYRNAGFYRAPHFNPEASFKVITLNTNDGIAGRIEHYLLTNRFRVISDHSFRIPGNNFFPNPAMPFDTSLLRTNPMVVNIPYMEERPSDYIIRYQFDNPPLNSADKRARAVLNIAVVNTRTGETEISLLSERTGRMEQPQLDRNIRDFVNRLRRPQPSR